jgi:hypothetical protein
MRGNPVTHSFNGGKLSPLMDGRSDVDVYSRGCRELKNFIATTQGSAVRRKGFHYVATSDDSTKQSRLMPFIFSEIDSVVLEFTDLKVRFFSNDEIVMDGASPYEIASPYSDDEVFAIKKDQLGDIMYLVHPNHRPYKLSRFGATDWTLEVVDNLYGPVLDESNPNNVTMAVSGAITVGGTATVTASAATFGHDGLGFQAGHIGSVWAFTEASNSLSGYSEWVQNGAVSAFEYRRYNDRLYYTGVSGTAGTYAPVHEFGAVSDGGVVWTFVNFGVGYGRMTSRTSSTVAVFEVQRHFPPTIVTGSPQFVATKFWQEAAWSDVQGYPSAVSFHEQRIFYGGTTEAPLAIDGSESTRRFESFDKKNAEDTAALRFELTGQTNSLQWLISDGDFLVAGTYGGLAFVGGSTREEPITPTSVKARTGARFGSSDIQAVELYNTVQYVARRGNRVYQAKYDELNLKYITDDLSVNNPEIIEEGIVQSDVMDDPYIVRWDVTTDGRLVGLSEENNQNVVGWHEHCTGERVDGTYDTFESIAVIPSTNGDQLWAVVNRRVGEDTFRYIEYMEAGKPNEGDNYFYVDSGIKYTGALTTVISGLDHLENEDVQVLADGRVQTVAAVSGVTITLPTVAQKVYVGKAYNSDLSPMLVDFGARDGTSQGKKKRIHELVVRLYRTLQLKYGDSFDNLKTMIFSETSTIENNEPVLFAPTRPKDKIVGFSSSWDDGNICIRQDQPLPATIVMLAPRMTTNDK